MPVAVEGEDSTHQEALAVQVAVEGEEHHLQTELLELMVVVPAAAAAVQMAETEQMEEMELLLSVI